MRSIFFIATVGFWRGGLVFFFGGESGIPVYRYTGIPGERDTVGVWRGGLVFFFWETGIPGDRETGIPVYCSSTEGRSTVVLRRANLL